MLCIYSITPWVIFQKKRVRLKSNRLITLYSLSYLSLLVQLHLLYHDAQIISMIFSHFSPFQPIYTIILYFSSSFCIILVPFQQIFLVIALTCLMHF